MSVDLSQEAILQLVVSWCNAQKFNNAAVLLSDEAGLKSLDVSSKLQLIPTLRKLLQDGDWAQASKLLGRIVPKSKRCFLYHLYRQEYIEMCQSNKGSEEGFSRCHAFLMQHLKSLEDVADAQHPPEFRELTFLLTCTSPAESPLFASWVFKAKSRERLATELSEAVTRSLLDGAASPPSAFDAILRRKQGVGAAGEVEKTAAGDRLTSLLRQAHAYQRLLCGAALPQGPASAPSPEDRQSVDLLRDYYPAGAPRRLQALLSPYDVLAGGAGPSGLGLVTSCCTQTVFLSGDSRCEQVVVGGTDSGRLLWWRLPASESKDHDGSLASKLLAPCGSTSLAAGQPCAPQVRDVALSPPGSVLAAALSDGRLVLLGTGTAGASLGETIGTILPETRGDGGVGIYSVSFSSEGGLLTSGGFVKTVDVIDVETRRRTRTFSGHGAAVVQVAFNTPGNLVYAASRDGLVRFFDLLSGVCVNSLNPLAMEAHGADETASNSSPRGGGIGGGISSATLSHDGRYLVVTHRFCPARVIDMRMSRVLSKLLPESPSTAPVVLDASASPFFRGSFCAADRVVALGTSGGGVRLWDLSASAASSPPSVSPSSLLSLAALYEAEQRQGQGHGAAVHSSPSDDFLRAAAGAVTHRTTNSHLRGNLFAASAVAVSVWAP